MMARILAAALLSTRIALPAAGEQKPLERVALAVRDVPRSGSVIPRCGGGQRLHRAGAPCTSATNPLATSATASPGDRTRPEGYPKWILSRSST
jgi:hypothetical protein